MKAGGVTVGGLSKTFVIGSFILNIFLAGILQELFAHIHKLQIMIHLVIVNVLIPPHTMLYFNGLLNFITFQIFDFRLLNGKTRNFRHDFICTTENHQKL